MGDSVLFGEHFFLDPTEFPQIASAVKVEGQPSGKLKNA